MATDEEIKLKIITKMLRGKVTGSKKVTVDTAKGWVASHDEGRAEDLIRDMITDPSSPIEAYGGSRDNVRLTSMQDGIDFVKDRGGDLPFNVG